MTSQVRLVDYETRQICLEALGKAERSFRLIENAIPRAQWVPWDNRFNWRFVERRHDQILLQKLARQISGIKVIDFLLLAGHLQEIGVLYRVLDEIEEDIMFLALGIRTENWTKEHEIYAQYFWSEDDADRQPPVPRKKIRAFVNRALCQSNPSDADANGRKLHKAFSDFVHARSAPIMGMVKGPPAAFELNAIHVEQSRHPFAQQNPFYFYRCLMSATAVANVVLSPEESSSIFADLKTYEKKYGALLF